MKREELQKKLMFFYYVLSKDYISHGSVLTTIFNQTHNENASQNEHPQQNIAVLANPARREPRHLFNWLNASRHRAVILGKILESHGTSQRLKCSNQIAMSASEPLFCFVAMLLHVTALAK